MQARGGNKLIIIGAGETAQLAYEYFSDDSDYDVVAFAVNREYYQSKLFNGLPVVPLEDILDLYSPAEYEVFVAMGASHLNMDRANVVNHCIGKGYHCASFVHSSTRVGRNVSIGANVMVMENCTLQHNVSIGNNCIIWCGCSLSHGDVVGNNVWIAPGVSVAGFTEIGDESFVGVGTTICPKLKISAQTFIGAGSVVVKDICKKGTVVFGHPAKITDKDPYEL